MDNYSFAADFLNKFSQLTPWVQVALGIPSAPWSRAWVFFLKETVRVIAERRRVPKTVRD